MSGNTPKDDAHIVRGLLQSCAHALRSYADGGNAAPDLARSVATSIETLLRDEAGARAACEAFGAGKIAGMLSQPSPAMVDAGARTLEGSPDLEPRELVRAICASLVRASIDEHNAQRRAEIERARHG